MNLDTANIESKSILMLGRSGQEMDLNCQDNELKPVTKKRKKRKRKKSTTKQNKNILKPVIRSKEELRRLQIAAAKYNEERNKMYKNVIVVKDSFGHIKSRNVLSGKEIHKPALVKISKAEIVLDYQCETNDLKMHNEKIEPNFMCPICGQIYSLKNSLICHLKSNHYGDCHCCPRCEKMYPSKQSLNVHLLSHKNRPLQCKICKDFFNSTSALFRHKFSHKRCRPKRIAFNKLTPVETQNENNTCKCVQKDERHHENKCIQQESVHKNENHEFICKTEQNKCVPKYQNPFKRKHFNCVGQHHITLDHNYETLNENNKCVQKDEKHHENKCIQHESVHKNKNHELTSKTEQNKCVNLFQRKLFNRLGHPITLDHNYAADKTYSQKEHASSKSGPVKVQCILTTKPNLIGGNYSCYKDENIKSGRNNLLNVANDSHQLTRGTDSNQLLTGSTDSHQLTEHQLTGSDDSHQLTGSDDSHQLYVSTDSHQLAGRTDSHQLIGSTDSHQLTGSTDSHQLLTQSTDYQQLFLSRRTDEKQETDPIPVALVKNINNGITAKKHPEITRLLNNQNTSFIKEKLVDDSEPWPTVLEDIDNFVLRSSEPLSFINVHKEVSSSASLSSSTPVNQKTSQENNDCKNLNSKQIETCERESKNLNSKQIETCDRESKNLNSEHIERGDCVKIKIDQSVNEYMRMIKRQSVTGHTNLGLSRCNICKKVYTGIDNLYTHIFAMHLDTLYSPE